MQFSAIICNILCNFQKAKNKNVQIIQKEIKIVLKFVHTYLHKGGTISIVKTPQYII